jgi:HlyD family secretion protein
MPFMIVRKHFAAGLLSIVCVGAVAAIVLASASRQETPRQGSSTGAGSAHGKSKPWVAAAPGRVEPVSGWIPLGTSISGGVSKIPIKQNDRVDRGDVLLQLEDNVAGARLAAAVGEAEASQRERDAHPITPGRFDRAEDGVFDAQRALARARVQLDEAISSRGAQADASQSLPAASAQYSDALRRLSKGRRALATARGKANVPPPNPLEAKVIGDRSKVSEAQAIFDETRIRAPVAGTVLQVNARVGQLAAPMAKVPLVVMGDTSKLRVRAEVDERDITKIKVGQVAMIRCDAYPGKIFDGRVVEIAPMLGRPTMDSRHTRQPANVGVMSVRIDLDGSVPLLPGMRTDVLFRPFARPVGAGAPPVS